MAALEKQRELQKKDVDIQAGGDNFMNALLALVEGFMSCSSFHVVIMVIGIVKVHGIL